MIVERAARDVSMTIASAREYTVAINSSDLMEFRLYSGTRSKGIRSTTTFSAGTWYNVVVVYNGDEDENTGSDCCKMYINGVEETSVTSINNTNPGTNVINNASSGDLSRLWIGAGGKNYDYEPDTAQQFVGDIHSAHIWKSRQITAGEADPISDVELVGTDGGLVLHRSVTNNYNTIGLKNRPLRGGTFRYGISNIEPEYSAACWRADHYGHLRDMLELRQQTATFDGVKPVKIRFVSGSTNVGPMLTYSQNLSTFATSSMPYFDDDISRNRPDNPDESLVDVIA
jgi:hypothetical protein